MANTYDELVNKVSLLMEGIANAYNTSEQSDLTQDEIRDYFKSQFTTKNNRKKPKKPDELPVETKIKNLLRMLEQGPPEDSFARDLIRNTGELGSNLSDLFPLESTPLPTVSRERDPITYQDIGDFFKNANAQEFLREGALPEDYAAQPIPASIPGTDMQQVADFIGQPPEMRQQIIPPTTPMPEDMMSINDIMPAQIPGDTEAQPEEIVPQVPNFDTSQPYTPEQFAENVAQDQVELQIPSVEEDNVLRSERDRLLTKSRSGLANRDDMLRYMELTSELGEVPNFTNIKNENGFFVQSEPATGGAPDTQGLSAQDSLSALSKYQGELQAQKIKLQDEAVTKFNETQQVLSQITQAIAGINATSDPLAKKIGQQELAQLQDQLVIAQNNDKINREQYLAVNGSQIDQEIAKATEQLKLAEFNARKEAQNVPDRLTPNLSSVVGSLYGTKDPTTKWNELTNQQQAEANFIERQIFSTPYAQSLTGSEVEQDKMARLYKEAVFPNDPELHNSIDLVNEVQKQAIREAQKSLTTNKDDPNYTVYNNPAIDPEDKARVLQSAAQMKMIEKKQKFGQDNIVANMDWYKLPAYPETDGIIEQLKTEGIQDWNVVVQRIPELVAEKYQTNRVQDIVDRMFETFQLRYMNQYGRLGMGFDMNALFDKIYNVSSSGRARKFLEDIFPGGVDLSLPPSGSSSFGETR